MANPQLEDGYLKIANELFDALIRIRIPGEARQVLDVIVRKTYGFNKKSDVISISQFCQSTGIRKSHIDRALCKLERMKLITKKGNGKRVTYRINKDFDSWEPLPKRGFIPQKGNIKPDATSNVPQKGNDVPHMGVKTFPKRGHTKDKKYIYQNTGDFSNFENSNIDQLENAALMETPPLELEKPEED
ncbi:MAG: replication protein [candidate division Zixibacteria bacterium]|nr:replication protein [candidate division Zixibacteria bacterium]